MNDAALHVRGVVLPSGVERDVFVQDGRFTFGPVEDARTVAAEGGFLIPGLVDAHCHLALYSPSPDASEPEAARASARLELEAGVLALREPGSPNRLSSGIGPHEGLPRTFTAGRFLAPSGGYVQGFPREADAEALPGAAMEELGVSGSWVKIIGDWVRPGGGWGLNYPFEALEETSRRIHEAGGRLAMHVTHHESAEMAIMAGFDSIEHGPGLSLEQIGKMAERDITWVPTVNILPSIPPFLEALGVDPQVRAAMLRSIDLYPALLAAAVEAGVRILAGTDAGMGPHGMIANEIGLLARMGLGPLRALAAGSWEGRAFLGLPGIEEGAPADLVAYDRDPREDPGVLSEPFLVILDGRVVSA